MKFVHLLVIKILQIINASLTYLEKNEGEGTPEAIRIRIRIRFRFFGIIC